MTYREALCLSNANAMSKYYQAYHKHTSLSHRYNKDSSLIPMDYFKYMKSLADNSIPQIYSTVEHGWQGNYFRY